LTAALYERYVGGDPAGARALHLKLLPLMRALFLQPNPIPVKAALAMMGRIGPEIRTPLAELDATHRPALQRALAELDLLEASS
jgi:4-hydroxy-tetrahydrodipicolinate synthase